jgi:hypothetical protein
MITVQPYSSKQYSNYKKGKNYITIRIDTTFQTCLIEQQVSAKQAIGLVSHNKTAQSQSQSERY